MQKHHNSRHLHRLPQILRGLTYAKRKKKWLRTANLAGTWPCPTMIPPSHAQNGNRLQESKYWLCTIDNLLSKLHAFSNHGTPQRRIISQTCMFTLVLWCTQLILVLDSLPQSTLEAVTRFTWWIHSNADPRDHVLIRKFRKAMWKIVLSI